LLISRSLDLLIDLLSLDFPIPQFVQFKEINKSTNQQIKK